MKPAMRAFLHACAHGLVRWQDSRPMMDASNLPNEIFSLLTDYSRPCYEKRGYRQFPRKVAIECVKNGLVDTEQGFTLITDEGKWALAQDEKKRSVR